MPWYIGEEPDTLPSVAESDEDGGHPVDEAVEDRQSESDDRPGEA